jgi:hypothetical protein
MSIPTSGYVLGTTECTNCGYHLRGLPSGSACPGCGKGTRALECVSCGYNLQTLSVDARCPECGNAVQDSLFVLPNSDATARAITLAAWALLCMLMLSCVHGYLIGTIIMIIAAFRLRYRCGLEHMSVLGKHLRRFFVGTLVVLVASVLSWVLTGMNLVPTVKAASTSFSISSLELDDGKTHQLHHSDIDGLVELGYNDEGRTVARIFDAMHNELSAAVLMPGQTFRTKDAAGTALELKSDAVGSTILNVNQDILTITPTGAMSRVNLGMAGMGGRILASSAVGLVSIVVGFVTNLFCIMACIELARRVRARHLSDRFRTILTMIVIAGCGLVAAPITLVAAPITLFAGLLPAIVLWSGAMLLLFIAAILQIIASFRLGGCLRDVPASWDEVVSDTPIPPPAT